MGCVCVHVCVCVCVSVCVCVCVCERERVRERKIDREKKEKMSERGGRSIDKKSERVVFFSMKYQIKSKMVKNGLAIDG